MAAKKKARSARTSRGSHKRMGRKSSTRSSSRSGKRSSSAGVTKRAVKAVKQVGRKLGIVNKR